MTVPPTAERRRRRWLLLALAAVAVVAAALVAALALREDEEPAFRIEGTEIIGPDGEPYLPVGVNMLGPNAFFNPDGVTAGEAEVISDVWQFNTVRLNACLEEGCPYTGIRNTKNNDLDAIVEEYVGEELVLMLALHQVQPGRWPDDDQLDRIEAWWRDVARRYGDQPYVWFNLLNEPGSDRPAPRRWLELHERLVRAIRDEGAENLIVVDGTQWGQEAGTRAPTLVKEEDSAILRWGTDLLEVDDQILFSFHVYDQWGPQELDDDERDRRLADYIDRVHDRGLALVIGEVGGDWSPCCAMESLGAESAYRVAPERGVGMLAWHGQSVDSHRIVNPQSHRTAPSDIDDPDEPTNLTWQGWRMWEVARGWYR